LNAVVTHFDDVYQQLTDVLRRIAKLQHQVDALIVSANRSGST
jgi:hypothetical protein